jgi:hypothetical protein
MQADLSSFRDLFQGNPLFFSAAALIPEIAVQTHALMPQRRFLDVPFCLLEFDLNANHNRSSINMVGISCFIECRYSDRRFF